MHQFPWVHKPPDIIGAKGRLSYDYRKSIIDKLRREVKPTAILERHINFLEAISGVPLVSGNKATLLVGNERAYAAMLKAIEGARDHVNIESYSLRDDEIGEAFSNLLLRKQAEGVQVNIIYDSIGSRGTPTDFFDRLRAGGIQVLEFNPVNPLRVRREWRLTNRDHRKILIVDGAIAFTGGVNIESMVSEAYRNIEKMWWDIDVQIEGPAVAEFQTLFLRTWAEQKGPVLAQRNYFPALRYEGDDLVRVIGSTPGENNRLTFIAYVSAIDLSDHSVHLTTPYFVPDDQMMQALTEAAQRGVDVKLILPRYSDHMTVLRASQYFYARLMKAGVKLYRLRDYLPHAKTAVLDGIWSTVGSTNMDLQSFLHNDEVNAVILGRDFAEEMEKVFADDLKNSDQIDLEQWETRPYSQKMREWFAHLFRRWF